MANLMLVLGPILALAVARLFGPLRVFHALGVAIAGQIVVFGGYATWRYFDAMRVLARSAGEGPVMVARMEPTLGGRLIAIGFVSMIAIVIALLALGVQFVVSRAR